MSDKTDAVLAKEKVRAVYPRALAIESDVGGWFISLGLHDGRELAYRGDGDIEQLWIDAASRRLTAVPKEGE